MPHLIDFHEAHKDDDRFAIIAFHDASAKDFAELDRQTAEAKKKYWKGRDLPFPVLLDSTGKTIKQFGIRAFPTALLIDPEGNLVGRATGTEELKEKLGIKGEK